MDNHSDRDMLLVYQGLGAKPRCVRHLVACLGRWAEGTPYRVATISPEAILQGGWQERAALLAIGGGFDRGFLQSLGSHGQALIREYVEQGGAYLGVCAGGYFACDNIEFDKDGPLEVCGPRELKFYPGTCIGPVFPGFQYSTNQGAHATKLSWSHLNLPGAPTKLDLHCYFDGGGYFEPSPDTKPDNNTCTTLAKFTEVTENPDAVVKCKVGHGLAVLSGVHFEYRGQDLDDSDQYLKKIIPALEDSESKRQKCVQSVMKHLGLAQEQRYSCKL